LFWDAAEIMPLWKLYYHLVWSTHDRQPLITSVKEAELYRYITHKINACDCLLHAIGGVEDHLHLVVSIPPVLSIAAFVKRIEGSSSHYLNQTAIDAAPKFNWQNEYGVFSLGGKQLEQAKAYVHNQKEHHSEGTTIAALEQDTER
jgi:putative transposase